MADIAPANHGQPERKSEPSAALKPPRPKKKPTEVGIKVLEPHGDGPITPRVASKRGRGPRCRSDANLSELLWVKQLASCLDQALPDASWPQNFELQLDRRGQLALTSVEDPEADSAAHSCLRRVGSVDVRLVPDEGFTMHCRKDSSTSRPQGSQL